MTDPVVLLGTQSNGETLPVQVDAFGRLVAEGLQGAQGPEGPEGPQGPPGEIDLPPDPYEGALLGWENGGLAWIGSEPIPIPPGVYGPITGWEPSGLLTIAGPLPDTISTGVYLSQCDREGMVSRPDKNWLYSTEFSALVSGTAAGGYPIANLFNGVIKDNFEQGSRAATGTALNLDVTSLQLEGSVFTVSGFIVGDPAQWNLNGVKQATESGVFKNYDYALFDGLLETFAWSYTSGNGPYTYAANIWLDGKQLVDASAAKLTARVETRIDDTSLVVDPTSDGDFIVGQYVKVEPQRVAPWLLYGNDPTSLIDHLRSS